MGGSTHTFSLLSNLSPPSALTITIFEFNTKILLRIPEHTFSAYEVIPFITKDRYKTALPNPHLYRHLFCGFTNYFKQTSAIWVGDGVNKPYGIKKRHDNYKRTFPCYHTKGSYEV